MDALKRVYLIGERTIDPKQQFAGSDGRMNTFSTFLNHVGEWFGPPLLLWAVPSGPCSEATNAESWTKICNSMSENDRTLARLNGRHRQFLGFQVVSPVCSTSGPGEVRDCCKPCIPRSVQKGATLFCFGDISCVLHDNTCPGFRVERVGCQNCRRGWTLFGLAAMPFGDTVTNTSAGLHRQ